MSPATAFLLQDPELLQDGNRHHRAGAAASPTRGAAGTAVEPDELATLTELDADLSTLALDLVPAQPAPRDASPTDRTPDDASAEPETAADAEGRARDVEGTGRAADSVHAYLRDIGRVPLLNAEKEVELAKRIEAGLFAGARLDDDADGAGGAPLSASLRNDLERVRRDGEEACRQLVEANLRLVVSVARRYAGRGMLLLDLIQEGNLGLIRAAQKFDYAKGYKFSTYATWWIRQSITRALAEQSRVIRLPVHIVDAVNALHRVERQMFQQTGRDATDEEVAAMAEITVERVHELRGFARDPISFHMPVGQDDGAVLGDLIEDDDTPTPADIVTYRFLRGYLSTALAVLDEREQRILQLRYGLLDGRQHTLEEVGRDFGLTRERIRQIECRALAKLRMPRCARMLRDYLQ